MCSVVIFCESLTLFSGSPRGGEGGSPKVKNKSIKNRKEYFFFGSYRALLDPFWYHLGTTSVSFWHYFWLIFGCFTVIFGIFGDISVVLMQI